MEIAIGIIIFIVVYFIIAIFVMLFLALWWFFCALIGISLTKKPRWEKLLILYCIPVWRFFYVMIILKKGIMKSAAAIRQH